MFVRQNVCSIQTNSFVSTWQPIEHFNLATWSQYNKTPPRQCPSKIPFQVGCWHFGFLLLARELFHVEQVSHARRLIGNFRFAGHYKLTTQGGLWMLQARGFRAPVENFSFSLSTRVSISKPCQHQAHLSRLTSVFALARQVNGFSRPKVYVY